MELVIMAAGMGSRFGSLKQTHPMGPNGEFIIDYAIYDAIKCGFKKVIFIIKEENYEVFKNTIGSRIEKYISVEYVFQKIDNIPKFINIPKTRVKPWGTAQAIYSAKEVIKEPFVVINADDFYGRDAYLVAKKFIENAEAHDYGVIGYKAVNTLTENGAVKRGILEVNEDSTLKSLTESLITKKNNKLFAKSLNSEDEYEINNNTLVSMNMLVLDETIFPFIEKNMIKFFKDNENDLENCEFLIPDVLNDALNEDYAQIKVVPTKAKWYGVTYKEDTDFVKNGIKKLIDDDIYPKRLW